MATEDVDSDAGGGNPTSSSPAPVAHHLAPQAGCVGSEVLTAMATVSLSGSTASSAGATPPAAPGSSPLPVGSHTAPTPPMPAATAGPPTYYAPQQPAVFPAVAPSGGGAAIPQQMPPPVAAGSHMHGPVGVAGAGRRESHSTEDVSKAKAAGCNLIINYLPSSLSESELRDLFEEVGETLKCKIVMNKRTHQSSGYGFVLYGCKEHADLAIEKFDGLPLRGKRLKVARARPQSSDRQGANLFLASIHPLLDEQDIRFLFHAFGDIVECKILRDKKTGRSRCIGFVRFHFRADAQAAIAHMNGRPISFPEAVHLRHRAENGGSLLPDSLTLLVKFAKDGPAGGGAAPTTRQGGRFGGGGPGGGRGGGGGGGRKPGDGHHGGVPRGGRYADNAGRRRGGGGAPSRSGGGGNTGGYAKPPHTVHYDQYGGTTMAYGTSAPRQDAAYAAEVPYTYAPQDGSQAWAGYAPTGYEDWSQRAYGAVAVGGVAAPPAGDAGAAAAAAAGAAGTASGHSAAQAGDATTGVAGATSSAGYAGVAGTSSMGFAGVAHSGAVSSVATTTVVTGPGADGQAQVGSGGSLSHVFQARGLASPSVTIPVPYLPPGALSGGPNMSHLVWYSGHGAVSPAHAHLSPMHAHGGGSPMAHHGEYAVYGTGMVYPSTHIPPGHRTPGHVTPTGLSAPSHMAYFLPQYDGSPPHALAAGGYSPSMAYGYDTPLSYQHPGAAGMMGAAWPAQLQAQPQPQQQQGQQQGQQQSQQQRHQQGQAPATPAAPGGQRGDTSAPSAPAAPSADAE